MTPNDKGFNIERDRQQRAGRFKSGLLRELSEEKDTTAKEER